MEWQPIETAPNGYKNNKFIYVLFYGFSKSLGRSVIVSGWMGSERKPIHNYRYKLSITHWAPFPDPPSE